MALSKKEHILCGRSELDYSQKKMVQSDIENVYTIEISPKNSIQRGNPIKFQIDASSDFTNLNLTQLCLSIKLVSSTGEVVMNDDIISPINNILHSMFSQVDVTLKNTSCSFPSPNYPYRAYIENLLNYSNESKNGWLQNEGWYPDEDNLFDSQNNKGFTDRKSKLLNGASLQLSGRLHCDLNLQPLLIPSNLDIEYILTPARNEFVLQSFMGQDTTYKIVILEAKMIVHKVKLLTARQTLFEKNIMRNPIRIPVDQARVQSISLAAGLTSFKHDSAFTGKLPKALVIGMVANQSYSGHLEKNPFNFQHFNLNFLQLTRNGISLPSQAYNPNFASGQYIRSYQTLSEVTGNAFLDWHHGISYKAFASGTALWSFNLSTDSNCSHNDQIVLGSIDISLKFSAALPETVSLILYSVHDVEIVIDGFRNVLIDS